PEQGGGLLDDLGLVAEVPGAFALLLPAHQPAGLGVPDRDDPSILDVVPEQAVVVAGLDVEVADVGCPSGDLDVEREVGLGDLLDQFVDVDALAGEDLLGPVDRAPGLDPQDSVLLVAVQGLTDQRDERTSEAAGEAVVLAAL